MDPLVGEICILVTVRENTKTGIDVLVLDQKDPSLVLRFNVLRDMGWLLGTEG